MKVTAEKIAGNEAQIKPLINPKICNSNLQKIAFTKNGEGKLLSALNGLASCNSAMVKNNISFGNNTTTKCREKISKLKNHLARDFFEELNQKCPEKAQILLSNDKFAQYCNSEYGILSDICEWYHTEEIDAFKKAVMNTDTKDIQNIVNAIPKRLKFYTGESIINGLILHSNDKKAFDHVINSPVILDDKDYDDCYSKDLCKYVLAIMDTETVNTLNYNSIIEIEKNNSRDYDYSEYTYVMTAFKKNPKSVKKMHNHLKRCVTEGDFTAYRGEKSPWMFESVPVDENMAKQIKKIAFLNQDSRYDLVFPNNHNYSDSPEQSVYDYICRKDKFSLADAMLVAKYGDKKFIDSVIEKIDNATVEDPNFKSFTLSKKFANDWAKTIGAPGMLSIVTKTNIKKGNQVGYNVGSSQYEFIVNDNPKIMTFSNAKFDKEKNTFYMDSEIEAK